MPLPQYFQRIVASQGFFCYYCEHRMFQHQHVSGRRTPPDAITKDHLEPRVYGGETSERNLVAACCQCNNLRGEMEAEAFKNLMEKWFKRDPYLWIRWHQLGPDELSRLKINCLQVHERQLRGIAKRYRDIAYRHLDFTFRERFRLERAW